MKPADDNFISSTASDVMRWLARSSYFEKLDDVLSPQDDLQCFNQRVDVVTARYFNVAEGSRLKAKYRSSVASQRAEMTHWPL